MSHTPGPWFHYDDSSSSVHRHDIAAKGKTVARVYCTKGAEEADKANARLIHAAPDMLAALKAVTAALNGRVHSNPALAALADAEAAIAKAEVSP